VRTFVCLAFGAVLVAGAHRGERSSAIEWAAAQPQPEMTAALPGDGPEAAALDEMLLGSKGRLQHWTHAPELVVLVSVMDYHGDGGTESVATDTTLTDAEADGLVSDLTGALATLTDHKYVEFAAVRRETLAAGSRASISRRGQIVVGRYSGVRSLAKTIGFGGRSAWADGTIASGAIVLDSDFDRTSEQRRLLRSHELGHALGYNHVQSHLSIMNPSIGPELTEFDRMAVQVAFGAIIHHDAAN
jgi:hypothetical protein